MDSRSGSSERRCNDTDSGTPLLSSSPRETEPSQSELASSNSTGSSSDGHSSNCLKATFLTKQLKHSPRSYPSPTPQGPPSSPDSGRPIQEQLFTASPPSRSSPLKKYSPLNPASLPSFPPKLQIRPSFNPLTPEGYRTGSPSNMSSNSSGSRRAYHDSFSRRQFYTPRSSATSTSSLTLVSNAKCATMLFSQDKGFVPFPLDPSLIDVDDDNDDGEEMSFNSRVEISNYPVSWRGLGNLITLVVLVGAIFALFIVYPICSFYRSTCGVTAQLDVIYPIPNTTNTDGQGQRQANVNARDQMPLPATSSGALTINDANGVEYDLTFSEEWETKEQDALWVSHDDRNHSNATTTANGLLLFHSDVHLQTSTPHCLEYGFVEVAFVRGEVRWTALWTGNWTFVEGDLDFNLSAAPAGPSLQQMLQIVLHIDYDDNHPSTATLPISIDHIHFYSLKARPYLLSCDDTSLLHVSLHLP